MIPWEEIDRGEMPGGGQLRLKRRGAEFSIMSGSIELMNSRVRGSEEALATLVCTRLSSVDAPQILIGGLGMGYTLRAALAGVGPNARVEVAELVPAVVAWARGPMSELFEASLQDPRLSLVTEDVGRTIDAARSRYDAILLDVDNGPAGLSRAANDRLYDQRGLRTASAALRPGGMLAVWSAGSDDGFVARLNKTGFGVEEVPVRANRKRGTRQIIWIATKAKAA
jgi:spermidine synthase